MKSNYQKDLDSKIIELNCLDKIIKEKRNRKSLLKEESIYLNSMLVQKQNEYKILLKNKENIMEY